MNHIWWKFASRCLPLLFVRSHSIISRCRRGWRWEPAGAPNHQSEFDRATANCNRSIVNERATHYGPWSEALIYNRPRPGQTDQPLLLGYTTTTQLLLSNRVIRLSASLTSARSQSRAIKSDWKKAGGLSSREWALAYRSNSSGLSPAWQRAEAIEVLKGSKTYSDRV